MANLSDIITQGSSRTFELHFFDESRGTPADPSAVSLTVTDLVDADVSAGWTATPRGDGSGIVDLQSPLMPTLGPVQVLAAGTVGANVQRVNLTLDVRGGRYVDLMRARDVDTTVGKYPWGDLMLSLAAIEASVDEYLGFALTRRRSSFHFTQERSTKALVLPEIYVDSVVSIEEWVDGAWVAWSSDDLEEVFVDDQGLLTTGPLAFLGGRQYRVVFEHGWFSPPPDLHDALISHLRHQLTRHNRQTSQSQVADLEGPDGQFDFTSAIPFAIRLEYDRHMRLR